MLSKMSIIATLSALLFFIARNIARFHQLAKDTGHVFTALPAKASIGNGLSTAFTGEQLDVLLSANIFQHTAFKHSDYCLGADTRSLTDLGNFRGGVFLQVIPHHFSATFFFLKTLRAHVYKHEVEESPTFWAITDTHRRSPPWRQSFRNLPGAN
jgi:hypothetical protein